MIKKILYIFIPVLAVFLMSHNVSALSIDLYPSNVIVSYSSPGSSASERITLSNLYQPSNFPEMRAWKLSSSVNVNMICYSLGRTIPKNTKFSLTFASLNTSIGTISSSGSSKLLSVSPINPQLSTDEVIAPISYFVTGFLFENSSQVCLGSGNSSPNVVLLYNDGSISTDMFILQPKINFYDENNSVNDTLNDTKQETQDAADNSSTAGDSSSSDATSATSSLLSVIGRGIGAITSATPSNCIINGNMGNLDMGQIDLCANPVPTYMATIGSFIAVMLVLPLVIILFNRFISIIRSFQT